MSQASRRLQEPCKTMLCYFINQLREKIRSYLVIQRLTTGGRALKFYASMRRRRRADSIKRGDETVVIEPRLKL